jgi:hypothetical protein
MPYQPWNRSKIAPLGQRWFGDGEWDWYVDDIDSKNQPIAWGCEQSVFRVMPAYLNKGVRYIICTDRGMYIRHPAGPSGRKPGTRYWKTPADAGRFVREHRLGVPA